MILDQIVEDKKKRLPLEKARISEGEMRRLAEEKLMNPGEEEMACATFYENLKKPGLSIIGELKKASHSLGKISAKASPPLPSSDTDALSPTRGVIPFLRNTPLALHSIISPFSVFT